MAKKGQKFLNYSFEFKLSAVNEYLKDEMGYKAINKMLGLPDHTYIRRWVKNYSGNRGVQGVSEKQVYD
ncbi:transposase-like protein [Neobacillus niacini]|uniref:transposase n=1 Tax=Neobacillus niacini TaxID=86668 RepID=UPI00277F33AA|nr:transposase [Neobacillus niacini]MDQ1005215.1 transposase-like protein [Neobacillus niacini]